MKKCSTCGSTAPDDGRFCTVCGSPLKLNICNNCGQTFDTECCPDCGIKAGSQGTICSNCGTRFFSAFCPQCGMRSGGNDDYNNRVNNTLPEPQAAPAQVYVVERPVERYVAPVQSVAVNNTKPANAKSKWLAFFLCFFFGAFGAHKFYEGKTGMGVLYFFTMGLFGFGWLIDTIKYLGKSDPYYV